MCNESCSLSVRRIHLYLPVSASQIEATEKPRAAERVQAVLYVRERVGVYLRGLVESPVVDAEPRRSILFLYQDGGTTPRTVAFLDDAYCQHVLDQLSFLFSARSRVTPDSLLYCGLVARVDPVLDDVSASEVAFSFGKQMFASRHGHLQLPALLTGKVRGRSFHQPVHFVPDVSVAPCAGPGSG